MRVSLNLAWYVRKVGVYGIDEPRNNGEQTYFFIATGLYV